MPVELKTQRDGSLRNTWYGRYEINGRKHYLNLNVKVAGTPPASRSVRDEGDTAFERSRAAALAKLNSIVEEASSQRDSARLVEKLYEIKTGESIKSVRLDELGEEWAKIPRKRNPNERYGSQCQSTLKRFAARVRQENTKAEEIAHVTRTVARAFMDTESKRGVTAKTWNDTLKLLRATFKHLLPAGAINPFSDMPTRETETVFRKPFSPEELKSILDVAQGDEFLRPLLIAGICTAMRRGDCCLLKWKDVDLKQRFITVKTAKTGQTVSIPIFPMLQDELTARAGKLDTPPCPPPGRGGEGRQTGSEVRGQKADGGYVFPEQALMYLENPDGITWRVKKVLATALGEKIEEEDGDSRSSSLRLEQVPDDELRRRADEYFATLPDSDKTRRMKGVFDLYLGGKKVCEVATAAEVSKGSVSHYLNAVEDAIGCRVVRGRPEGTGMAAQLKRGAGLLGMDRASGKRRASVWDFHSFRVTWVTLALTAGVPLELVQKVTGHKTTDIVLKHYFQPGREAFRQALHSAMPKLLTNGQKSPKDEMREIVGGMTAKTWKADNARLMELMMKM